MDNEAMMNRAKQLVVDYFNSHVDATDGKKLTMACTMRSPTTATRRRPTSTCTRSGRTSALRTETPHIDGGAVWTASLQA